MARERPDPLRVLTAHYRLSKAGRTGCSEGDFILDYKKALAQFGDTASQIEAEELLRSAAASSGGVLRLETHSHDPNLIFRIRLLHDGGEAWLFEQLGERSPTQERSHLAEIFASAETASVPLLWKNEWSAWCKQMAAQALEGGSIVPFSRDDPDAVRELLAVLPRLLSWEGESLIRFGSCSICHDSKRLEKLQTRLEAALRQISGDRIRSLEDLGLTEKPRQVMVHGPLRLEFPEGTLDLGLAHGPIWLSEIDIRRATQIHCDSARILTVENEAMFLELAKLRSGTILVQTSYPGRAVVLLLSKLPREAAIRHFGDSDPAGFDILRDLRERVRPDIKPLHMTFRRSEDAPALSDVERRLVDALIANPLMQDVRIVLEEMLSESSKGAFEQESLGRPMSSWPFYS